MNEDLRQFHRIALPFKVSMRIKEVYDTSVESRKTNVFIHDIGYGGLKFTSPLNFPVDYDIVLEFDTLYGLLTGGVVWKVESDDGYMYGVRFTVITRSLLSSLSSNKALAGRM